MDIVNQILDNENNKNDCIQQLINVEKEIDVDIDEGTLLVSDYNTLNLKAPSKLEPNLEALTRDNVQLLINKIWTLPIKCVEEVILAELPKPKYVLPRSRKLPKPKSLTKWQQFAKDKGIRTKKKGRSKLKWDDLLQKWIPTYGFRNVEAEKQKEWLVECHDDGKPIQDPFVALKASKNEKKAKNELQRLRNLAKARKVKIPKVGFPSSEHFKDSKQLSMGAKIAEVSTASMGQFNEVLKKNVKKTKGKKVTKKKKSGQLKELGTKNKKKPKAGKGNRDFRKKVGGRKRRQ
ncbi:PREDICTED: ribosome biogenesis regulatory protein homolog [Ceratosolen solmsi marchali]|uniref:Ribosome biogenesis regulatory protein n=1 Tax=Ceratosolen solmsi marchali TaxID=326594 RepID=A0AAJ6YH98_9HYME|nr:PREDICTED: ribosome biogenesis regulatory protein homolog [Ceratosolen solmsi marchali]